MGGLANRRRGEAARRALIVRPILLAGLFAASSAAHPCGYCVEDKIAAVYDHGAVMQAIGRRQTTVFFFIDGPIRESRSRLHALAESTPGVQHGSVRVSVEAASLALAIDPRRANLATVQNRLEKKLRPLGLSLLVMQTMDH